jgi:hypothetical protein
MSDGTGTNQRRPNGVVLGVEVRWCPGCHADKTVELVRLASDPEPVAVCTECGVGLEAWLTVELVEQRTRSTSRSTGKPPSKHGQGAA